jgi:hypothetical protein
LPGGQDREARDQQQRDEEQQVVRALQHVLVVVADHVRDAGEITDDQAEQYPEGIGGGIYLPHQLERRRRHSGLFRTQCLTASRAGSYPTHIM